MRQVEVRDLKILAFLFSKRQPLAYKHLIEDTPRKKIRFFNNEEGISLIIRIGINREEEGG